MGKPKVKAGEMNTRDRMLHAAFDLFHEKGLHATSVDDILEHSGAGKSQFYHYFKSKEGLIHELLQSAYHMIKNGETHLQPINSWEEFRFWLDAAIDKQEEYGCGRACPIGQISGQLSDEDELLRQDVKLIFEAMKDFPKGFFIKLQAKGELPEEVNADALADLCVSAMQGGALLTKVNRNKDSVQNTADHLFAYIRSLAK